MLVIMALVTTVMATPTLLYLMRGTELEPYIRRSSFLGAGPAEKDLAIASSEKMMNGEPRTENEE